MGPCFQFFDFCVSYTNLRFYAQGVAMKKWFFHHFFCVINITNTMTNIEIRDFVSIFSGKGLISIPIMESCAEFTQLTLRFHLLSAAQIHDRRARCLIFLFIPFPSFSANFPSHRFASYSFILFPSSCANLCDHHFNSFSFNLHFRSFYLR